MKTLRTKPVYKLYFRYKNITLWKNKTITNLTKKKWMLLKASKTSILQYNRGIYLYHYKKLNLTRLYYYKFINKQLLKKYLTNYNESSFKSILLKNFQIFEKRLDFNLYQAHFVPSLYAARFFITKGYILVNKCVIKNTNFLLNAHDLVEINPKFWVNNFAIINKNKIFENKVTFLYLRNIEIDYTTLSFIFLDNKQFYIIQFENFIKKIYFNLNQKKLFNSTNKTNVLNNYFKFFETTFNYYLFLDESNKNLKYKIKTNNFRVLNLLKYLRFYYNDYFFRNILLKRIFSYKYNYLNYIINIANLNTKNVYLFQNINNNFISKTYKNLLQNEFYKYIFNCIFKYYIYLLKNYYINNSSLNIFNSNSINNYNFILLNTRILIYVIRIKILLTNYFKTTLLFNNNYIDIYKNNKYKLININCRPINNITTISKKTFLNWYKFQILLYYISSNRFKYKIYRKCNSFKQNIIKRHKLILQIRKAFNYRYYNQFYLGNSNYLYSSHFIRNRLINSSVKYTNNHNNIIIKKEFIITNYYPKTSFLYKTIYSDLSNQINITKTDLQKELYQIKELIKNKNLNIVNSNFKPLNIIMHKLMDKLNFFTTDRSFINFNYNKIYKNIFLLLNIIKLINNNNINYNLTNITYTFLSKINVRNNYLYTKYNNFYTMKRYTNYFNQRLKVNYYYINNYKIRHIIGTNLKKYFLPLKFKIISNSFLYSYNRYRKQRSKYFYKRINNITNNCSFNKIYNNNYYFNMNLISDKLKFNDNLFYIDLLLNSSVRKINKLYNYTTNLKLINTTKININLPIRKFNSKNSIVNKQNCIKNYKFLYYSPLYTYYRVKTFNINIIKFSKLVYNINNKYSNLMTYNLNKNMYNHIFLTKYFILIKKHLNSNFIYNKTVLLNKTFNFSKFNFNLLINYYTSNIRKYKLIKYLYKFYIFKEYNNLLNQIINFKNIKTTELNYIKQLYYNLLFTKLFNFDKYNDILQQNYYYSRNLRIMINYFIIIKRLYK